MYRRPRFFSLFIAALLLNIFLPKTLAEQGKKKIDVHMNCDEKSANCVTDKNKFYLQNCTPADDGTIWCFFPLCTHKFVSFFSIIIVSLDSLGIYAPVDEVDRKLK